MKNIISVLTFMCFFWCNFTIAVPISTSSGVIVNNNFVVAGGGPLPPLFDSRFTGAIFQDLGQSTLDAPDTINFEDSNHIHGGHSADNPTIYYRTSSATRNLGTEGAASSSNYQTYRAGGLDLLERGLEGEAFAQVSLSSEFYEASTNSRVFERNDFRFTNHDQSAFTFSIQGIFELDMFALANGENAFAETYAFFDMFFQSENDLDIQFADIELFNIDESSSGENSMVSITRDNNIGETGHLTMNGYSSAGNGDAFGSSRMAYVLGITLQPGESITMQHRVRYSTLAEVSLPINVNASPTFSLLMLSALGLFAKRRHYLFAKSDNPNLYVAIFKNHRLTR